MSTKKNIATLQEELIEEFAEFEDWQEKYEFIIELGFDLPDFDCAYKNEKHRILGCQSNVWIHTAYDAEKHQMIYTADSESMIVKGLISMLIHVLSEQPPEDVLGAELHFLNGIGLDRHLSSTRSSGLVSMLQEMKKQAALHVHDGAV